MKKGDLIDVPIKCQVVAIGTEPSKDGAITIAACIPVGAVPSQLIVRISPPPPAPSVPTEGSQP